MIYHNFAIIGAIMFSGHHTLTASKAVGAACTLIHKVTMTTQAFQI